ncbi:MAG: dihydroorotase [Gammaproteobacteria bacterium]|nr:dihydroorotase [Gammaproteobacteria bacterium]
MTQRLVIIQPDDWHLHLRDGAALAAVAPFSARQFRRAVVMPNLRPPVTNAGQALAYRQRILDALPRDTAFNPLMTLYLTDKTSPEVISEAAACEHVVAVKLYPAGATTNSDFGVTKLDKTRPALEQMAALGMPLLVHGEVTDETDVFEREKRFIDSVLAPLAERHPQLKIVLEHITTSDAVTFVNSGRPGLAATVTPQHLLMNRNALFAGGVRPHHFCLPVLKHERHREAVMEAATSGSARFFLGTDSAPHARSSKENACGCAGIFSAHAGIELYAEAFEQAGRLDKLQKFASENGPDFYGLPRNTDTIALVREPWQVPASYSFLGNDPLVPLKSGETLSWRLENQHND